jgi:ABC-2 type transport system permease protein
MRSRVRTQSPAAGPARAAAAVLGVSWAFLTRSVATTLSYRAKLSLGHATLELTVVTFVFVGRVVAASGPGFVERFGIDYTTFVIVGVLVHGVAVSGLRAFRAALRREQLQGTLELLVASAIPLPTLVLLSGAGELAVTAVGGAVFLTAASALAGLHVAVSVPMVAGAVLYVAFMSGVGLASAGFVLVSKEGDPISWLLGSASGLLGGVYFPVELLPRWLGRVASVLPTTRALALARSGLGAHGPEPTAASLLALAAAAGLSVAFGLLVLQWGHRRARRKGTLGEY